MLATLLGCWSFCSRIMDFPFRGDYSVGPIPSS